MIRRTWLFLLGLSSLGALSPVAAENPAPRNLDQMLEAIRAKHSLPALAAIVVKDGQVVAQGAVGLRKLGATNRVTINDKFHIGSCTKAMTATLAARLVEQGRIRWDSQITEVIPDLKPTLHPQYTDVTLEQLLAHRAGLPAKADAGAWNTAWERRGAEVSQRFNFIRTQLSKPPEVEPGTKFLYSNQGYSVAGAMLEAATRTPWEILIRQSLFGPLKMDSPGFGAPGLPGGVDQPWGHTVGKSIFSAKPVPLQEDNPPAIGPGGTVHCSLPDMAKFLIEHLQGHRTNTALLKQSSYRKLHTAIAGDTYALGWNVVPRSWAKGDALTHSGSNTMNFMVMWLAPERDFGVVVATNIAGDPATKGCDEVSAATLGMFLK